MTIRQEPAAEEVRIGAAEVRARLEAGEPMTILDVRNDRPWEASPVKVRSAIRVRPADFSIDPAWPKSQLTVVY